MQPAEREPRAPTHFATRLLGVQLFREHSSRHLYRVWHEDWYALCVVDSGAGEVRYRSRTLSLAPSGVTIFAPGNAHETRRVMAPATFWVLLLPAAQVNVRSQLYGRSELQLAPETFSDPRVVSTLRVCCTSLANPATPQLERELLYSHLLDMLCTLDARGTAGLASNEPELGVVRRVREHLLTRRLDCNASLTSIAKEMGCSAAYLSKAFSVSQACPPKTLLRLVRVERARQHLMQAKVLVKDAGLSAGFRSAEKFNQAFHDVWNLSPTAYRTQFKAK